VATKRLRVDQAIKVPEVRLIGQDGEQMGVVPLRQALVDAERAGLSLVEVSPNAAPPVCKIMDYGRHVFGQKKKQQKPKRAKLKEVKIRPTTEENDYQVKLRQAIRFMEAGSKVKVSMRFRGRELWHRELAVEVFKRMEADVIEYGSVEQPLKLEGRQMMVIFAPKKQ
jgi:translation initiation factor IF-3